MGIPCNCDRPPSWWVLYLGIRRACVSALRPTDADGNSTPPAPQLVTLQGSFRSSAWIPLRWPVATTAGSWIVARCPRNRMKDSWNSGRQTAEVVSGSRDLYCLKVTASSIRLAFKFARWKMAKQLHPSDALCGTRWHISTYLNREGTGLHYTQRKSSE